ncbi:dynein light chain Tctex-type 3 isoform X2 [Podarcis muralis]|uniref:dynein light chain Tctex-type 3 isoform X2 n=1 Tax=Podarcis muralis TaxID=64176 RepID=UPI0010A06984|nr:dynein light chain Tctex-type 3 isoform X2 [Podarcis muralis]
MQMTFNAEEAHSVIKDCIEGVLGKADYNHDNVNQWTAAIVEQSLTQLVKLGKTYKYIVTCAVMQKCGAGLHTASSCFWDTTTDGTCTVRWENRTMNCIVNVFAVAIIL